MPTKLERLVIEHYARRHLGETAKSELHKYLEEKHPGAIARAHLKITKERDDARFIGKPPAWAIRMVRKHESRKLGVRLEWRRSRFKSYTSGRCRWDGRIIITANGRGDEAEMKAVLAHELAHDRSISMEHDDEFYDELYAIATKERILRDVMKRDTASAVKRAASRARRARAKASRAA